MQPPKRNTDRGQIDGRRDRSRGALGIVAVLAAGAVLAQSTPGLTQEDGARVWSRGGCTDCHGNLAAGGVDPAYPTGPNLRRTRLDRDQLIETISCGRPGTEMPSNLRGAYTEVSCYGLPVGEVPPGNFGRGALSAEEVAALVDFLLSNVVGVTRITRENCAAFYGGNPNALACQEY